MTTINRSQVKCWLVALAVSLPACQSASPSSDTPAPVATANTAPAAAAPRERTAPQTPPASAVGDSVDPDGDCAILYPKPSDEMAAEARATVPLKTGLTLSHTWRTIQSAEEIECLAHVENVDALSVRFANTCLQAEKSMTYRRQTCRKDLRTARVFQTRVGIAVPETLVGATSYSLSRQAFLDLKREGATRHQYLEMKFNEGGGPFAPKGALDVALDGTLTLEGPATMATIVNDASVDLPVLRVSGTVKGTAYGKPSESRIAAAVIDDERFPLMLEYRLLDLGAHEFSVRYNKISFPTEGSIERKLAEAETVDVYGIYFDFASDKIRAESDPVLKEIADALVSHPQWTLRIVGHTDSVGSDTANLDLSRRRSASVRAALVDRHGIAAGRLLTDGYGEGAPKDTNDTPEGRARNRRVELSRR